MVNGQSHVALPGARRRTRGCVVASTVLLGIGLALAAPGDLDPGFNGNGLLSLQVGDYGAAGAVVQQDDGKLVFAGFAKFPTINCGFVAVRVAEDGTPDSTFGTDGVARTWCRIQGGPSDVIQQEDGKLVLAGTIFNAFTTDIALARFNTDGTADETFGVEGIARLDIDGSHDFADGLIQQSASGGKLVIAGEARSGGKYQLVFARFNTDGTLDTTFGTGGTTIVDFGSGFESGAKDLVQQSDGKLVAAGTVSGSGRSDFGIARVTKNGALDPSFDADGRLTVDMGGDQDQAFAVAIQPDDAIVVAGYIDSPVGNAGLLRVKEDGSLDDSFAAAGKAVVDLGNDAYLNSIVVQEDGKLVATGTGVTDAGGQDMILTRFHSDGTLDTNYGTDGIAIADFGAGDIAPNSTGVALIQQVDGKYVAVGPNSIGSFGAARFDDDAVSPGLIGLTVTSQNVSETDTTVTYTVRRTGGKTGAVSVDYATAAGQAQPGSDFDGTPGTLSWNDGEAGDKSLSINLIDDVVAEEDEDFSLTLSAPTGGAQLAASKATTMIASEDGPGRFEFKRALDALKVSEDILGNEGFALRVPVQRTAGSEGAVSVKYRTTDGTATAGTDYQPTSPATLTWAEGETGVKFFQILTVPDSEPEGDEDFQIQLRNPTGGATIEALAGTQLVRILDDDWDPDSGFGFANGTQTFGEAAGSVTLNILRSGPVDRAVSVRYATSSGSATAGADFTSASGTVNWEARDTGPKTIAVNITNDSEHENDETFTVALSNPSSGASLGSNPTATVRIVDDDAEGGGDGGGGGALDWLVVLFLTRLAFGSRLRGRYV